MRKQARAHALQAGHSFVDAMHQKGFRIAAKSVIISSAGLADAQSLAKAFSRSGIPIQAAAATEDLGVSAQAAAQRTAGSSTKRLQAGSKRAGKVGILTKFCRQAASLYKTGVRPQQCYDMEAQGASPRARKQLRKTAVRCMGNAGFRPCGLTLLEWR